jgi:hypothetical protein
MNEICDGTGYLPSEVGWPVVRLGLFIEIIAPGLTSEDYGT